MYCQMLESKLLRRYIPDTFEVLSSELPFSSKLWIRQRAMSAILWDSLRFQHKSNKLDHSYIHQGWCAHWKPYHLGSKLGRAGQQQFLSQTGFHAAKVQKSVRFPFDDVFSTRVTDQRYFVGNIGTTRKWNYQVVCCEDNNTRLPFTLLTQLGDGITFHPLGRWRIFS